MKSGVSDYVAVIDLGSSKIVGCLGKKELDGKMRVLALEQVPVKTEVRRGVIHNIEEVSKTIQDLIQLLSDNEEYPCKIDQVYVGLNGYTIRTVDVSSTAMLPGDVLVTEGDLFDLQDDANSQIPEDLSIMESFVQEFIVDGMADLNPVGSMPQRVEGHYKIVGGKSAILRNLETCMGIIPLNYETLLGPVASAEAVLRPEDKSKGAVAIDFGAQTTGVCIYKNNLVRYVAVLPFGGNHITKDLLQLNIDEEEAEVLKISKGTAIHYTQMSEDDSFENELGKLSDFDKEANDIVVARIEEIVENIWAQIRYSGIDPQKLAEGIVLTGGASQLNGLVELLRKKTDMPVRIGNPVEYVDPEISRLYARPEFALCMGLLLLGKQGCCSDVEIPVIETPRVVEELKEPTLGGEFSTVETQKPKPEKHEKPKKVKENKKSRFGDMFKTLFADEDL